MAAGLKMSTSFSVHLALEDDFLGFFGLRVFLWDPDFLDLFGCKKH